MTYAKAVAAGIYSAIIVAIPVVDDGLKASEVLAIVAAALVGAGLVAAVPNKEA